MALDPAERYARHAEAMTRRMRAASQSARDIAPMPSIESPERRRRCSRRFRDFCDSYFPHAFTIPFSADHKKVIAKIETAVIEGGLFAVAMPRGSGKTTLCEVACLFALLNGYREFVCLIGSSEPHASEMLQSLKAELDGNDLLLADYPEVCYPIRALDGIVNRARGQLYEGQRTNIGWTANEIVLPTIRPPLAAEFVRSDGYSLASGAVVRVAGITGRIRGMKHKTSDGRSLRPSLVIVDDPQTDEVARSRSQIEERERVLVGAVLGLAGPGVKISGIMPCTVIQPDDLADRMLDVKRHPEWNGERTKLVYSFPVNEQLWKRYAEIRADSMRAGNGGREATEFYLANRAAMDEGAVVAWPERFNPDEVSAIQHAMNIRIERGDAAFFAEYQNEPLRLNREDSATISEEELASKVNRRKRLEVPIAATYLTAFVDVHGAAHYYMVCAWEPDMTGYVIDYGTYPEQHVGYFRLDSMPKKLSAVFPKHNPDAAIYAGIQQCVAAILGQRYINEAGAAMQIQRLLIDANWGLATNIVYQYVAESDHQAIIAPSHGRYYGAIGRSFAEHQRKPGDLIGNGWRIPAASGRRAVKHVAFESNYWKSIVANQLIAPLGSRGCISIFGRNPSDHRLLFEHLMAEYRVPIEARGRKIDEWRLRANHADNHWWDCLVGCAVAASICGASLTQSIAPNTSTTTKPQRMTYADFIAARARQQ